MSDPVRVNGNLMGWASVKIKINDIPYTGISAIDYGQSRERGYGWGTGRHQTPYGMTSGKYTPKPCVMTVWASTAAAIRADLAAQATDRTSYGNVRIPIVVQKLENDLPTQTDEILECALTDEEQSHEEGPDGLQEKLTFMPLRVLRNGLALFDATEGGV